MLKVVELSYLNQDKWLFNRLSFQLEPGNSLIVTGANGSGKTTLLRFLSGLFQPHRGDIFWQGQSIASMGAEFTNQLHYLGHKDGIKTDLTVCENLKMQQHLAFSAATPTEPVMASPTFCAGRGNPVFMLDGSPQPAEFTPTCLKPGRPRDDVCISSVEVASILSLLQLEDKQHTLAARLSSGQKRRLALARLLMVQKPLWLLDEPLTALDAQAQTLFLSWLDSHLKKGGMAIISSHHVIENQHLVSQILRL